MSTYFDKSVFANRFDSYMKKRGFSREYLAEKLGLKRQSVDAYVDTKKTNLPGTELLFTISKELDVSSDYLIGRVDDPISDPGIRAIVEYTGLSSEAIKKLHRLKTHSQDVGNEGAKTNKLQLDTINRMLSSIKYKKTSYDPEVLDPADDPNTEAKLRELPDNISVEKTTVYTEPDYFCHSIFEDIGHFIGLTSHTIQDKTVITIYNGVLPEGITVNELYGQFLLNRINDVLKEMKKENK